MSDAWFNTADERAALEEAEKVGMTVEQRGPRWLLYPLVGVADPTNPIWFDDLNALRQEVKARLARQQASQPPTDLPPPPPPQAMMPPDQDVFADDDVEEEDDTPHPTTGHRRPVPRRRR